MIEVKRKVLKNVDGTHIFPLYTVEEADALGIEYLKEHWTNVQQGQWCITDDNLVVQCLKLKDVYDKNGNTRKYALFPFGYKWISWSKKGGLSGKHILNALEYIQTRAYNRTAPITWGAKFCKARKNKLFFKTYARMVVEKKLNKSGIIRIANHFFPKDLIPVATMKVALRQTEVKKKMEEEIVNLLVEAGIPNPKTYGIKLMDAAAKIAEEQRDAETMLKIAKEFNTIADIYPKKVVKTERFEGYISQRQISSSIDEEEAKLEQQRMLSVKTTTRSEEDDN